MKKVFFVFCIVILLAVSVVSVVLMYQNDDNYSIDIDSDYITSLRDMNDVWEVKKGKIVDTLSVSATVSPSNEQCLTTYSIQGKRDSITLLVNLGDKIEPNAIIAKQGEKDLLCTGKMKCVDILWTENGCEIICLDYGKLYLTAYIPIDYIKYDLFDIDYKCKLESGEAAHAHLVYVDYVNQNGTVAAKFELDEPVWNLLPGTVVRCEGVACEKEDVLKLPLLFVTETPSEHYVEIVDHGVIRNQKVQIGVVGDNSVEILGGLSEGDVVLCPNEEFSMAYLRADSAVG